MTGGVFYLCRKEVTPTAHFLVFQPQYYSNRILICWCFCLGTGVTYSTFMYCLFDLWKYWLKCSTLFWFIHILMASCLYLLTLISKESHKFKESKNYYILLLLLISCLREGSWVLQLHKNRRITFNLSELVCQVTREGLQTTVQYNVRVLGS